MKDYINKVDKIAQKEDNIKFLPDNDENLSNNVQQMDDLEDYKELKDIVNDWEKGMSALGKNLAPVPIPVNNNDKKKK